MENKQLIYFNGNELAASVWTSKYGLKDKEQKLIESTPDDMHKRMAKEFARIEQKYPNPLSYDHIYNRFKNFGEIIPQGSVMSQLGNPYQIGSLSNCIVLPKIYDSYGGIMRIDEQIAQLEKRRCGVGADISTLRPSGMRVSNAAQTSTGAVSFMHRFSNTTREVAQDGRRGALMITLHCNHPDIASFATIKNDLTKVTGANISIKLCDEFMDAVERQHMYTLRFPVDANPEDAIYKVDVNAKQIWDTIVASAHKSAEPGLIFWDKQHIYSPSSIYLEFENISTNPCSEIAMGNDSCRLIANNLMSCVRYPYTNRADFDFKKWYQINSDAMKLMDDLVDLELEAIERILEKIKSDPEPDHIKRTEIETWEELYRTGQRGRRTGLGFTGLADAIAALGLKYGSENSLKFVEKLCRVKLESELTMSIDLAEQRGAFPAYDAELELKVSANPESYFYMLKKEFPSIWKRMQAIGRRNISWSTIAPTGSLSLLALLLIYNDTPYFGETSGLEPMFNLEANTCWHVRKKKINPNDKDVRVDSVDKLGDKWQHFKVFHAGFQAWADINVGIDLQTLSDQQLKELVEQSPYGGSGSSEISWKQRVELQAIIQKYITHSISSTINLPADTTVEDVSNIYFESWRKGLKGITVYRDGSRSGVLVSGKEKNEGFNYKDAPKRPIELPAEVFKVTAKGKKWTVAVGLYEDKPYEVFAIGGDVIPDGIKSGFIDKKGKGAYDFWYYDNEIDDTGQTVRDITANMTDEEEALTRMISTALRHGSDINFIVEQLNKSHGSVVSFGKAIARVLSKYAKKLSEKKYTCQSCKSENVRFEEGCYKCVDCGSSKCG